jgi:t-SNARE complex subunit (syntaxin)
MSESEIKEAADRYVSDELNLSYFIKKNAFNAFTAGLKMGREHADKEAYNRAIQDAITTLKIHYVDSPVTVIEELQKLRK